MSADSKLSHPGPGWRLEWVKDGALGIQLDIVGFLAILGEDAVKKTSRLASLSTLFYIPRLLPAPHSLLYAERPEQMETIKANVTGIYSGANKDSLTHIAAALFGSQMQNFQVRCLRVTRIDADTSRPHQEKQGQIRVALTGPVALVNILGIALSATLFIVSLVYGDGMSLIATILLSLLSTLAGFTNKWNLAQPKRARPYAPAGDALIRWPNGSFLILKCDESIARDLIFGHADGIDYALKSSHWYIGASLLGTIFLMISVITLANAKIQLQFAWAGAYVLLNIGHWAAAALPRGYNWSFPNYDIEEEYLEYGGHSQSYTEALWNAIIFTKQTKWVEINQAMPETEIWQQWLEEAERISHQSHVKSSELGKNSDDEVDRQNLRKSIKAGRVHTVPNWDPVDAYKRLIDAESQQSHEDIHTSSSKAH